MVDGFQWPYQKSVHSRFVLSGEMRKENSSLTIKYKTSKLSNIQHAVFWTSLRNENAGISSYDGRWTQGHKPPFWTGPLFLDLPLLQLV